MVRISPWRLSHAWPLVGLAIELFQFFILPWQLRVALIAVGCGIIVYVGITCHDELYNNPGLRIAVGAILVFGTICAIKYAYDQLRPAPVLSLAAPDIGLVGPDAVHVDETSSSYGLRITARAVIINTGGPALYRVCGPLWEMIPGNIPTDTLASVADDLSLHVNLGCLVGWFKAPVPYLPFNVATPIDHSEQQPVNLGHVDIGGKSVSAWDHGDFGFMVDASVIARNDRENKPPTGICRIIHHDTEPVICQTTFTHQPTPAPSVTQP